MNDLQALAAANLRLQADLEKLVADIEREPLWQQRETINEPARSQLAPFADGFIELRQLLDQHQEMMPDLEAAAAGQPSVLDHVPAAHSVLEGLLNVGEILKGGMLPFLALAREARGASANIEGAGSSAN